MKNKVAIFLVIVILTLTFSMLLTGCSSAPKLSEVYDRVVEIVEHSFVINSIIYGAGMPSYQRDSLYAEINHLYDTSYMYGEDYDMLSQNARYFSQDAFIEEAAKIYSEEYLKVLQESTFVGYAVDNAIGGTMYAYSRYVEGEDWMYISNNTDHNLIKDMRIYDYATMKIISPSNKETIFVEMDTWTSNNSKVEKTQLKLVFENNNWYLDGLTV